MENKNIHVLTKDKPSRLYFDVITKELLLQDRLSTNPTSFPIEKRNIYITSDEEMKEGDWILDVKINLVELAKYNHKDLKRDWLKIILTTDVDLINNGVQAIDDEFLEWICNNSSCEKIDVVKQELNTDYNSDWKQKFYYKIIIPKEKSKKVGQITEKGIIDTVGNCPNCGVEFHIHKDITENQQQQGYSNDIILSKADILIEQSKEMEKQQLKSEQIAKEHFRKQRDEGILDLRDIITESYSQGRIDAISDNPYATDGENYYEIEFLNFPTSNIIDKWLDKNGNPEITKQVEEEGKKIFDDLDNEIIKKYLEE